MTDFKKEYKNKTGYDPIVFDPDDHHQQIPIVLEEYVEWLEQRLEASPLDAIVGRTKGVICPYCEHELSDDEMYQSEVDLYALAPNEDDAIIDCPACHEKFTVHGSYTPIYETLPLEME